MLSSLIKKEKNNDIGESVLWNENYVRENDDYKGYRMVFACICEHASSAFIFESRSSDLGSSQRFVNFPLGGRRKR